MRKLALFALTFILPVAAAGLVSAATTGYHVTGEIKIGGEGGWDYLTVDSAARALYVSHATHVAVIDLDANKVVGDIPDTPGVHGIAIAPELNRGFISNGRAQQRDDLRSEDAQAGRHRSPPASNPGLDPLRRRSRAACSRSTDDRRTRRPSTRRRGTVAGTIALGRKARVLGGRRQGQGVREHRGHERDRRNRRGEGDGHASATRSAPCEEPVGPGHRREEPPAVLGLRQSRDGGVRSGYREGGRDAGHRRRLGRRRLRPGDRLRVQLERRRHADDRAADGRQVGRARRTSRPSAARARSPLDEKTHKLYLSTAKTAPAQGGGRATFLPDTFKVLVVGK